MCVITKVMKGLLVIFLKVIDDGIALGAVKIYWYCLYFRWILVKTQQHSKEMIQYC